MPKPVLPLWFKILTTLFFGVVIVFNATQYGWVDLLWFCDVAMMVFIVGVWVESPLLVSMAALSCIGPQIVWMVDFFYRLFSGNPLLGFTDYMFEAGYPLVNFVVSLFHIWMPLPVLWGVSRMGYDPRGFKWQTAFGSLVILLSYVFTEGPHSPAGNLNQVYGLGSGIQQWMHPWGWLALIMLYCVVVIYLPSHLVGKWLFRNRVKRPGF